MQNFIQNPNFPDSYWKPSSPEAENMDGALLQKGIRFIEENELEIHGFVVIRNKALVMDYYGNDLSNQSMLFTPYTRHLMHSTTKNVISALIGLAIADGYIKSVTDPILSYFPDLEISNRKDKESITIEDFLVMRSGLEWQEGDSEEYHFINAAIPAQYVLNKNLVETPGTAFNYTSGGVHVLADLLHRATEKAPLAYAKEKLFHPIGVMEPEWKADKNGINWGPFDLILTPREIARFGWLYLNRGNWEGRQIIPQSWIDVSTRKHIQSYWRLPYGYLWWILNDQIYMSQGAFGQNTFIIKDLGIVVSFTANLHYEKADVTLENFVLDFIVPSAK